MICAKEGCRAHALRGDDLCFAHSMTPESVQKRKEARSKGGSKGRLHIQDLDIRTVEDVRSVLSETVSELRSTASDNLVSKSRTIGYLCGILLTALEKSDLEERIVKLEEAQAESTS